MTKTEYIAYESAVAAFFEREGLDGLSSGSVEHDYDKECTNEDHLHYRNGDYAAEPYFSWHPCDCCGSTLGGDREDCVGYNPTTDKVQGDYSVCVDCIYYNEYGTLDDATMIDMVDDTTMIDMIEE